MIKDGTLTEDTQDNEPKFIYDGKTYRVGDDVITKRDHYDYYDNLILAKGEKGIIERLEARPGYIGGFIVHIKGAFDRAAAPSIWEKP